VIVCVVMLGSVGWSNEASAHRLDEYLQATRIGIGPDRIAIDIDLTPGANIADRVLGWIDTDRDGAISAAEGEAYVRGVLRDVSVDVDGVRTPLGNVHQEFPAWDAVRLGTGSIRVHAATPVRSLTSGHHRIAFVNAHRPGDSVYLANALAPADARIQIAEQQRDRLQRSLTIEYDVAGGWTRFGWLASAAVMLGGFFYARRRRAQVPS
jgi:hypothetical protein